MSELLTEVLVIFFLVLIVVGAVGVVATASVKAPVEAEERERCSCLELAGDDEWCEIHGRRR